jgi:hypothetical protein
MEEGRGVCGTDVCSLRWSSLERSGRLRLLNVLSVPRILNRYILCVCVRAVRVMTKPFGYR